RVIRVVSTTAQRGQQVSVNIELDAQGNENAVGCSLSFNSAQLNFISAALGADAAAGTININNMQASEGRIGLAMALPFGQNFGPGTQRIITVTFLVPSSGTPSAIPIEFVDKPITREVASANADVLQATWLPGNITVPGTVASVSAASFLGNDLASEQI